MNETGLNLLIAGTGDEMRKDLIKRNNVRKVNYKLSRN